MALIYQGKKTYTQEIEKWLKFITEKGDKIEGDYEAWYVYSVKKFKFEIYLYIISNYIIYNYLA